jgi:N-acetylglutamate synthase-like GNAT family acetyltransferase
MNIETSSSPYNVVKATKSDKKDIMRFYKTQHYSASYIGQDQCYLVKRDHCIIACAIVSAGQESGDVWLLHGLVTDKDQRGKNIASLIVKTIINDENELKKVRYGKIICFADSALQAFYKKNHFINHNTSDKLALLPEEFSRRLTRYREKQQSLHCFLYNANE